MKPIILTAVAGLILSGCTGAVASAGTSQSASAAQPQPGVAAPRKNVASGGGVYNGSVKAYPDETKFVLGGQVFYFYRYIPFMEQ
jgi:hypothetical protein